MQPIEASQEAPAANLIDALDRRLRSLDSEIGYTVTAPRREGGRADVTLVIQDAEDPAGAADAATEGLLAGDGVATVKRSGQRLLIRFEDERLARIAGELEAGAPNVLTCRDLLSGRPYIVDFCDPNATKALHVGHLRGIALGNAVSRALETAGARVVRQSQIGDIGRGIGEAMAGYARYAEGRAPEEVGQKSDHFVGRLYSRYVSEASSEGNSDVPEDAPVAREIVARHDLADELLARLGEGDDEAQRLWRSIRDWAVAGQDETLARLGVTFDRQVFESQEAARIAPLLQLALDRGLVVHDDDEALVYRTGQVDYPQLPLTRPDGFPTQNLRTLTIWHTLMHDRPGETVVHLQGSEWTAHAIYLEDLLGRLAPELPVYPTANLVHGMVSADDGLVTSVGGDPILLDDIFDTLADRDELNALALAGDRGCEPDELAAIALLGASLDRPLQKPLTLVPGRLLDEDNAGWVLLRAWVRAWDPANDGAVELALDDPAYRFVVVRSQLYRRLVALAVERLDVLLLVRFLVHLSRWYLDTPDNPSTGRVMRTLLREGLGALGLVRPRIAAHSGATLSRHTAR